MSKIGNEQELHYKVVDYIKRFYSAALLMTQMGELQDADAKRIDAYKKGYQKGSPDLILSNYHINYQGLCIELKARQIITKYRNQRKR